MSAHGTLGALLTKNWVIKKRHPFATLSEILNPLLCILFFAALKTLDSDLDVPPGWATAVTNESAAALSQGSNWNLFAKSDLFSESLNTTSLDNSNNNSSSTSPGANSSSIGIQNGWTSALSLASGLVVPKFYFVETTMPGLLLNLGLQSLAEGDHLEELSDQEMLSCFLKFVMLGYTSLNPNSLYAVPPECRNKVVPYKIAITPDTLYTRNYFAALMETWYPRLPLIKPVLSISALQVASFKDSRVFFNNESALEAYITSESYGLGLANPKIYAAIAFQEFPRESSDIGNLRGHDIEYSLRLNSTYTDTNFPGSVPRTISRRFNLQKLNKEVKPIPTLCYATRGFMTLQTTVSRFLNCLPVWDAKSESTNGTCQIKESTMKEDPELDNRLLNQLKDDLIVGSALKALEGIRDTVLASSSLSETVAAFMGPIKDLAISVDDIPATTKEKLLQSLRQAPQAFHGAATFMSPIEGFHYAVFFDKILAVFPVGFILSYLYSVSRVIVALLMEKETRSRELMRILGVDESYILFAWFMTYLQLLLVASLLQTLGARALLFQNSDFGLLFGFFLSFALSSFGYGFLISSLFSRARAGSFVGMGLFFMMFFASFGFSESSGEIQRTLACLLSPVALAQGINIITQVEAVGVGINSVNASEIVDGFRFVNTIWMQILDFFVYVLVGLYFEKVTPREFGVSEKWYFCLTKTQWQCALSNWRPRRTKPQLERMTMPVLRGLPEGTEESTPQDNCEAVSGEMKQQELDGRAVVIANLRKEFDVPGGTKVAVKKLSLSFYEGQVTCLLGHNGAGKTTLMSMLTGMIPPSSGDAWIRGNSIASDMHSVRKSLGYCPQHSVLYPELTVEEHLQFYGRVKGLSDPGALSTEVKKKIEEVGLTEKRYVLSHALSGGMKRKLSLAIAFLGESRVVFLDEPTSGMDPYSRRSTWELIQANRRERVLILTTHFMDEADILGDRIAIMAEGELKCVGSSLFLKKRFGVGYRLSFVQAQKTSQCNTEDAEELHALVLHHVPQARADTDVGTELTFQLPFECSPRFPGLFEEIEAKQQVLGILAFAISVTTLEEIFLRVAEGKQAEGGSPTTPQASIDIQVQGDENTELQSQFHHGNRSFLKWFVIQLAALLRKRVLSATRDRSMLFFSTILPIVIIFVGLSALKVSLFIKNDPKVTLTTDSQYDLGTTTPVPYSCTGSSSSALMDPWCSAIVNAQHFRDGAPYPLEMEQVVYQNSTTPTVFGVSYTDPSIQPNDMTGFCLRFGELAFEKGYGHDASTLEAQVPPVEGQNGGFVLYGSQGNQILGYNVMVNSSSIHGGPLYKAMVDESIHRFLLSKQLQQSSNSSSPTVRVGTHPFPLSFKTRSIFNSFLSLPAVIFVVTAFTFIPAAMMPFLVKEKQNEQNAKHQQLLSGVSLAAYWLANFIFDIVLYLIPMGVSILLLKGYGITSSLSSKNSTQACQGCTRDVPEAVLSLFFLFGGAIAPWTYLMSHIMKDPGACLLYTVMINFFFGLLLLIISVSLDSLTSTQEANQVLIFLWRCSPLFSLGNGLLRVIVADIEALYGLSWVAKSAFTPEIAGNEIAYLAAEGPIFFLLALVVDWIQTGEISFVSQGGPGGPFSLVLRCVNWVRQLLQHWCCHRNAKLYVQELFEQDADDEDVANEARRVLRPETSQSPTLQNDEEVVRLLNLQKTYPNGKKAVANLSFGLTRGECFGFLGVNGAGKTTTMKILTGDISPSSGSAKLNGLDILTQRAKMRQCVGYCPQFDALLELLTVREHLEFYGRLKGFGSLSLCKEVNRLLRKLQLKAFERKLAGSLSGGNKRKLSVAIAMLGGPDLLFLDEPSTGMDPHARRFMWDVILQVSVHSKRTTVMLTTHSMEECEALCNKAAIMVGGKLRCFGSIPHLKARFGDGFLLECKLYSPNQEDTLSLIEKLPSNGAITSAELPGLCAALGKPGRVHWIISETASQHPTGSILQLQLNKNDGDGALNAKEFCDWWLLEDRVEKLTLYLETHFGSENTTLLERQADFCRFKLSSKEGSTSEESSNSAKTKFSLSRMFELVEAGKQTLYIKEYSISQTSLEQIFNSFARQQQEETRVAKGLWAPS